MIFILRAQGRITGASAASSEEERGGQARSARKALFGWRIVWYDFLTSKKQFEKAFKQAFSRLKTAAGQCLPDDAEDWLTSYGCYLVPNSEDPPTFLGDWPSVRNPRN